LCQWQEETSYIRRERVLARPISSKIRGRLLDEFGGAADLRNSPLSITEIPQVLSWVAGPVSG
jgi:hypothetical protein